MAWIDLTAPISDRVNDYIDGVTYARLRPIFTLEHDGVESHEIVLSTLSGTYFETGRHVKQEAISIDEVPLDNFILPAAVLDVGKKGAKQPITVDDLSGYADHIRPGDALIVRTGWCDAWNTPHYFEGSPFFTREAFEWLLAKKPRIIAGDIPSYDNPADPQGLIRRLFEKEGVYLLAPLVNTAQISDKRVELYAFPLKVEGVSGAPARVLVREAD